MTSFIFALIALLCWSGSDIFSKMGTEQNDNNSEWRVIIAVGLIMGLHAILTIVISPLLPDIPFTINEEGEKVFEYKWWHNIIYTDFAMIDFIHYLPIACIYIIAMVFGYLGLRYIELSVSSPICNSSGSLALVICMIFGIASLTVESIIGVVFITLGIILLGIVEYNESDEIKLARCDESKMKYTKSLIAIIIPIVYLILDALGTVGDEVVSELSLFEISEYSANTSFELTFLLFAIFGSIWIKFIKKENLIVKDKENIKARYLGATCETIGQIFYMAVMFSDFDAGMPMISSYCVLSVLLSRIFLKEKLYIKHYISIGLTIIGIIILGIFSPV